MLLIAIVPAVVAAVAVIALATGGRTPASGACHGALIPAYRGADALARLTGPGHGRIVIVNPANGPGTVPQPALRRAIAAQLRAGATVVGYVHTGYATRDPAAVQADVRRYRSWYGANGVFLDEVSHTTEHLPYYQSIVAPLRASGATVVVNPGMVPAPGYFDVADVVVTFEGPADTYAAAVRRTPPWLRAMPRRRVAHLLYGASAEQATGAAGLRAAGYFYATSGTLPDPWNTVPAYLGALEGGNCA